MWTCKERKFQIKALICQDAYSGNWKSTKAGCLDKLQIFWVEKLQHLYTSLKAGKTDTITTIVTKVAEREREKRRGGGWKGRREGKGKGKGEKLKRKEREKERELK